MFYVINFFFLQEQDNNRNHHTPMFLLNFHDSRLPGPKKPLLAEASNAVVIRVYLHENFLKKDCLIEINATRRDTMRIKKSNFSEKVYKNFLVV